MLVLATLILVGFTDNTNNNEVKYELGWIFVFIIFISMVHNMKVVLKQMWRYLKMLCKKYRLRNKKFDSIMKFLCFEFCQKKEVPPAAPPVQHDAEEEKPTPVKVKTKKLKLETSVKPVFTDIEKVDVSNQDKEENKTNKAPPHD